MYLLPSVFLPTSRKYPTNLKSSFGCLRSRVSHPSSTGSRYASHTSDFERPYRSRTLTLSFYLSEALLARSGAGSASSATVSSSSSNSSLPSSLSTTRPCLILNAQPCSSALSWRFPSSSSHTSSSSSTLGRGSRA